MLHLLSLDIADDLSAKETQSAFDLSERLSGHALAISQMAGLIHRRSWSIEEFLAIYDENTRKMHGATKGNSLDTVWYLSFKSLDSECSAFLGVLSYVAPDSIPMSLFEQDSSTTLPREIQVYQDQFQYVRPAYRFGSYLHSSDSRKYRRHSSIWRFYVVISRHGRFHCIG